MTAYLVVLKARLKSELIPRTVKKGTANENCLSTFIVSASFKTVTERKGAIL